MIIVLSIISQECYWEMMQTRLKGVGLEPAIHQVIADMIAGSMRVMGTDP